MQRAGQRIVVVGADRDPDALDALVAAGAEVHSIGAQRPAVAWLASHTDVEVAEPVAADLVLALDRIGAVVHELHVWIDLDPAVGAQLVDAARAHAIDDDLLVVDRSPGSGT